MLFTWLKMPTGSPLWRTNEGLCALGKRMSSRGAQLRAFRTASIVRNSGGDFARSKEVGAKAETQDITEMDQLLRISRGRVNPKFQNLLPVRSRGKWMDTLRESSSASTSSVESHPLTPRTMSDSYCELLLPFASSPDLWETYTNTSGGIRTGMLMEHLDSLAGSIAYKHILGPDIDEKTWKKQRDFYIVTASVERLDMLAPLHSVRDLRLSGQVIYVGRSSMEVVVRMEALDQNGREETVMLGRFCMVCRDSVTHKASKINTLHVSTPEDEALRRIGEAHKDRRTTRTLHSLSRLPPSSSEAEALHFLYLQSTIASESSSHEPMPSGEERVPMGQTRLEKTMMMYPQERNVHGKIFGGYLMRLAYELGYSNSMIFTRGPVRFLSLDNISFARPVPIGSVLRLKSYILHTASSKEYPAIIHTGVKANVVDVHTGKEQMTNDFRFTWCREEGKPLHRMVVPMTYEEAMWWIEGRRALELGTEIRTLRHLKRGVSAL